MSTHSASTSTRFAAKAPEKKGECYQEQTNYHDDKNTTPTGVVLEVQAAEQRAHVRVALLRKRW